MNKVCYAIVGLLIGFSAFAQETDIPIIKAEVQESQVMFKKTVWRRMDLNEKQNRMFNSKNNELSTLLLTAVEEGLLKPYQTDSCLNLMSDEMFNSNTQVEVQSFGGGGFDNGFGGGFGNSTTTTTNTGGNYDAIPKELFSVVYLKEEIIFDRNRSRMYWYIRTVSIALPGSVGAAWNPAGFEKIVAHFKYDDVVNLVRGAYADKAIWYNNENQASHRNFGDAFELRLFKAPIVKVSNADNLDIRQITTDPFEAILLQEKYEHDLMEYESELWEY